MKKSDQTESTDRSDKCPFIDLETVARFEPVLAFLYRTWWKVDFSGLDRIPAQGPALVVGNQGSILPWQALMLSYAVSQRKENPRKLYILWDLDSSADRSLAQLFSEFGFLEWSSTNMKTLFDRGELVAIFPEGVAGLRKPFSYRNRLEQFDWTLLMPAVEAGVDVYPLSSLGFDEINPMLDNFELLSRLLKLPFFPVTPFFPWLPAPFNLFHMPIEISMSVLREAAYQKAKTRDDAEKEAKSLSLWLEGEIQAELNRLLRHRVP